MQKLYLIFILLIVSCGGGGSSSPIDSSPNNDSNNNSNSISETCEQQQTNLLRCDFKHQGLDRYYLIQPSHPEAEGQSSLILNLHGYGSNALAQMEYTGLNNYTNSKENNFILIHPQGAPLNTALTSSASHWNSGAWTIGSTVDDVDFIDTIINLVSEKYNINVNRIYSTGMSNGGFMSYHLACNLSSKIAAIASVTGSMSKQTYESCNPEHPTPVLQIHGTLDGTVPFDGNSAIGMEPIEKVMTYWQEYNSCDVEPLISVTDFFELGSSVEHWQYFNCLNNVQVELYKIDGMWHTWPQEDRFGISASQTIWDFFNTYDLNGKIN
jgi:polyhydroxybutyrate depolymerase